LVIDDTESRRVVRSTLEGANHVCAVFVSAAALLRGMRREDHDLVLIGVDRGGDWRALLEQRSHWTRPSATVILLGPSASGAMALDAGADDFVAMPVAGAELLARVQTARRRQAVSTVRPPAEHAGCAIDEGTCSLRSARARVELTAREMAVARLMFAHAGKLVSRRQIALGVWGCDEDIIGRSIEQHMYQLRRKLRRCVGDSLTLRSVYGSGYRLDVASHRLAEETRT